MTDLARTLEVTPAAVSKYEAGERSPAPDKIDPLIATLGFPLDFFLKPMVKLPASAIFYRSMTAATKGHRDRAEQRLAWMIEISRGLQEFVNFPVLNLPAFEVPADPAELDDERIEQLAGELRWHWRLGDGAISDVTLLMENHGVVVARTELGASTLDAFSQWDETGNRAYVILGSDKASAVRSRFDVAHELGHLVLHRAVRDQVVRRGEMHKLMETQAHRFAGAFLLPARSFAASVPFPGLEMFRELKPKWKVSIGLMIRRCLHVGLITRRQYEVLSEEYGRRRWRTREPMDDLLPAEQPRLLRRALELVVSHGVLSRQQIVERYALPPGEIEPLVGLPDRYLDGDSAMVRLRPDAPMNIEVGRMNRTQPEDGTRIIPFRSRREG
jgi:Zn-dependent peptidase ImmA (M78 family)